MKGYIYLIKDHLTNKVYIGKSHKLCQKYLEDYFGSGKIIKRIIKKRKHHLEKIILGYCETKEELAIAEITCIEFYDAQNPLYGYNITAGGEGHSAPHSQATKIKIGEIKKGNKYWIGKHHSEETKQKIRIAHLGTKLSSEHKQNISKGNSGVNNAMFGKKHSIESKMKMRLSHLKG